MNKVKMRLCLLLFFFSSQGQSSTLVLTHLDNKEMVAVNQRVAMSVSVLTDSYFTNGPVYRLPAINHALVLQQDKDVVSSFTDYQGVKYVSQTFTVDIYPTHVGVLTIPSLSITTQVEGKDSKLETQAFTLVVSQPTETQQLGDILVSDHVDVNETWDGQKPNYKVGDIVTRKVVIHAEESTSLIFPDFVPNKSAHYTIQIGSPQLQDVNSRNDNFAELQQTLTYTIKESGRYHLGGETLRWWKPSVQELESYQFKPLQVDAGFSLKQFLLNHWAILIAVTAILLVGYRYHNTVISMVRNVFRYLFSGGLGWLSLWYRHKTRHTKNINLYTEVCSNDALREKVMEQAFSDNQRVKIKERVAFLFSRSKLKNRQQ
ncbi:BatD family protein [Vibrio sp. CyArs1]|uniref:BatD family protein n=1 Tax=Vibrio sp. CyArs1 TaxID=2682577 RepID=UPI001F062BF6|nr:BatD family protein [Vibrio sp. CyArs1]